MHVDNAAHHLHGEDVLHSPRVFDVDSDVHHDVGLVGIRLPDGLGPD